MGSRVGGRRKKGRDYAASASSAPRARQRRRAAIRRRCNRISVGRATGLPGCRRGDAVNPSLGARAPRPCGATPRDDSPETRSPCGGGIACAAADAHGVAYRRAVSRGCGRCAQAREPFPPSPSLQRGCGVRGIGGDGASRRMDAAREPPGKGLRRPRHPLPRTPQRRQAPGVWLARSRRTSATAATREPAAANRYNCGSPPLEYPCFPPA